MSIDHCSATRFHTVYTAMKQLHLDNSKFGGVAPPGDAEMWRA